TFKLHQIIEDSFKYPNVAIYLLNIGFDYKKIVTTNKLTDLFKNTDLFIMVCNTGTMFDNEEILKDSIRYDKFEIANYLAKKNNDYDKFFRYSCQYYKFDMIEKNI